jgi:drug/metabolite transporter (DMT)-like permease
MFPLWFIFAFLSALLSAAAAVTQKKILFRIDAVAFSFLLSIVLMLFSFGTAFVVDVTQLSTSVFLLLLVKSLINAAAFLLVMMALQRNGISSTLPLLGLTPGVTALLAYAALGESISGNEILGLLLMIGGVFLLERNESAASETDRRSNTSRWFIASALLLFAVSSVFDKYLVSGVKTPPLVVLFYQHAVFLLLYGVLFFRKHGSIKLFAKKDLRPTLLLVLAVAVFTMGYRYTQLAAVQLGSVALVLAVKRTSVFFAALVGGKLFKEKRLLPKLAAAACIIAAGFIILRNVG